MPPLLTLLPAPRRLRDDSGQSMIELAVMLPLLFAVMFGFIQFCMVMLGLSNISFAARLADRYACLHSSTSLSPVSQTKVNTLVARFVIKYPSNTYSSQLTYGGSGNVVGGTATVKVSVTYTMVIPFKTIPNITLSSTASGTIIQ
jgi:Flp pilus assembly protein TadG